MKKIYILTLLIISFQGAGVAFGQNWRWQNPFPAGNGHFDIAWIDEQTLYAAGTKGQFLVSNDFGTTWSNANIPTSAVIREISFLNRNTGYAATDNGEIWYTENGGATWSLQFTDPAGATFRDISFYDDNSGYVAGDAGFVENVVFRTHDGGKNWEPVTLPQRGGAFFYGVFFIKAISSDTVVCTSWDNTFFRSYDGGTTWDTTHLPSSDARYYEGAYFATKSTGYIVGPNGYVIKTNDLGKSWQKKSGSPDSTSQQEHYLSEAYFLDENTGWVSSFNCLYKTIDGGENWTKTCNMYGTGRKSYIQFNNLNQGLAVAGIDIYRTNDGSTFEKILPTSLVNNWEAIDEAEGELFVAGSDGVIFHSQNGGETWKTIATPVKSTLNGISFYNKNSGWVTGADSTILKTTNKGLSWELVDTDYNDDFSDIQAWNASNAILAGKSGAIFKTSDGGATWIKGSIATSSHLNSIHFPNQDTGYVAGRSGLIARTTDGGLNWVVQNSGVLSHLNDIYFLNGKTGYAAGNSGKILFTDDAGETWEPLVSNQSGTLNSVYFYDEQNGYATGRGIVLVTSDGGNTWETQDTPSGNTLTDVFFITPESGWAVGNNGNILYYGNQITGTILNEDSKKKLTKVFPNPVSSASSIILPYNYTGNGNLQLFSESGETVYESKVFFSSGKCIWKPGSTKNGIYTFRIYTDRKVNTGKILIQK